MATLEERVAYLEGKVEEHSRGLDGVREAVVHLEQRMDGRFEAVDRRFEAVDRRFESLERRLDALDQKLDQRMAGLDQKLDQRMAVLDDKLDQRTRALGQEMSRQFVRLVGVQMTTLIAILGAIVGALLMQ